jgi:uncharacterized protein (TIGR00369 family)
MDQLSLQERYSPLGACFGCGPTNEQGLRIRSIATGDDGEVVCDWRPKPHHEAYPGMLNGGIVGTLLDCHSNWAAAYHLMRRNQLDQAPCTVTADYAVKLLRPTPTDTTLHIAARVVESTDDRAIVEAEITANGKICATCRGTFVAVKPGHPAYHRW